MTLRVLSLGAGVQSSTLALMAEAGEIEKPDVAIFADTGAEPRSVYRWLEYVRAQVSFPVVTVSAGNLAEQILGASQGRNRNDARPPFFVANADGSIGMLRRQCTQDFKIDPIRKKLRELLGIKPRERGPRAVAAVQVIGISSDEAQRMKASGHVYIENEYPLVNQRLTRGHCLEWMKNNGHPAPPKSACTFCPYRSDAEWSRMKNEEPDAFAQAVAIDEAIRAPGYGRLVGRCFVHRSGVPLSDVRFDTANDAGQLAFGFSNECEGMCGN